MKKILCICMIASGLFLYGENPYAIKSLNPVQWKENTKHAPLDLVKSGKLNFVIVAELETEKKAVTKPSSLPVNSDAWSVNKAVKALQTGFQETTGSKPEVLNPDSPKLGEYQYKIYVGRSKWTDKQGLDPSKLPVEGFLVKSLPDGIVILGRDGAMEEGFHLDYDGSLYHSNGSANGAYDFLERFLGIRFYYPGIGTILPKVTDLQIQAVHYTDAPYCRWRSLSRLRSGFRKMNAKALKRGDGRALPQDVFIWKNVRNNQAEFPDAFRAHKSSRFFCLETPHPFVIAKLFPDKINTIFYRDPETGELNYSSTVYSKNYFDTSNPAFADILIEYFKLPYQKQRNEKGEWAPLGWDKIRGFPNSEYLAFGQVDQGRIIRNERTKGLPEPKEPWGKMSEVHGRFIKILAERAKKEFPGKTLTFTAYSNYLFPPEHIEKLPDNVQVMVCTGTATFFRSPVCKEFFLKMYRDWYRKTGRRVGTYTYSTNGFAGNFLRGYYAGEFLRETREFVDPLATMRDGAFPGWGCHIAIYLDHRCLWNYDFDVEAAVEEYCQLMYGPKAAVPMKKFFDLVRDRWENQYLKNVKQIEKRCIIRTDLKLYYKKAFTAAIADQLQEYLDQAKKMVPKDSLEAQRILFFEKAWEGEFRAMRAYSMMRPPLYKVKWRTDEIEIDGKLDDKAWRKAGKIQFMPSPLTLTKITVPVDGRMLWDRKGIYIAFRSPAPFKQSPESPWGGDNLEFFLSPGSKFSQIYQFVYSPSGAFTDYFQDHQQDRPFDEKWNAAGIVKAVHADQKGWSCEMFIPFASLEGKSVPVFGDIWNGNFISNRTSPHENTALSRTLMNNREPMYFGKFQFCGNCQ